MNYRGVQEPSQRGINLSHLACISDIFSRTVREHSLDHPLDDASRAVVEHMAFDVARHPYLTAIAYQSILLSQSSPYWDDVQMICEGIARNANRFL